MKHVNSVNDDKISNFKSAFYGLKMAQPFLLFKIIQNLERQILQRRLKKFGMDSVILTNFYRCTIESILTGCITVWYGSCTAKDARSYAVW